MQALLRDIRYGFRSLRNNPLVTVVATIALTFGIGLTTTMFSITYGALMIGLPFDEGDRIASVERGNVQDGEIRGSSPIHDYADYKEQQKSFEELAAMYSGTVNVSGTEKPERYDGTYVTANTFEVLRVRPILGRSFAKGDDTPSGPKVAVISYAVWRDRYAKDPGVIDKQIRVNGIPFTVIGVMPDGFVFPNRAKIWLPLQVNPLTIKRGQGQYLDVFGRLKPGATLETANTDLAAIAKRLETEYKETNQNITTKVRGFIDADMGPEPRQILYTMLGAVFFVLLIACANVANLLLDRAAHRTKEVGIRTALGASRRAIVRQFLAEALALSAIAAVLGLMLAYVGIDMFNRAIADQNIPFYIDIRLHPPVLLFTVGISMVATMLSGAIPAIQSSRADINEILKDESRGASSFRIGKISKGLVMFEIALSCALLVASGLMIKSVVKLRNLDPGFETKTVFTARVGFPGVYTDTVLQKQFFEQLEQKLAAIPGVAAASVSSHIPGTQQGMNGGNFAVEGKAYAADRDYPTTSWLAVTPGFFTTLNLKLLRGRGFTWADRDNTEPVAIVNQRFAATFFPGVDPIGRRLRFGTSRSEAPWLTIVGISADVYGADQENLRPSMVFRPFHQSHSNFAYIATRTAGPPLALTSQVRDVVAATNPDIPIYWPYTLDEAIARPRWFIRVFGTMFMIFGVVALFLAATGLYAVMSFSVSRRTREVGIRMALGAQARDVVRLIFRQGAIQLLVGMTLGLALAVAIANPLTIILFDVQPRDPTIFAGVAATLAIAGLLATYIPARRATRVDPLVALRSE
jgi:putative ABC transport system permease protein